MNKKLFQKIVLLALAVAVVIALIAPAIFGQTGQPRQEKLLNGLKVLMWPDKTSEKVSVRLRIHSGSAFDPQGKEGTMQMLADNLFPNEAAREFFTDDLGGSLEITSNYDFIEINASSTASQYLSMLETIASVIASPPIDKETTAKLKTATLARIASSESDPAYVADHAVAKRLFGTFPYGRPRLGTAESVQKIEFADLIDAKLRFLTADNATLAMQGNFPRDQGFAAVRRYFGAWLKSDRKIPATFRQPDEPQSVFLTIPLTSNAGIFRFAMRGPARGDKDLGSSLIFTSILENRLLNRLTPNTGRDVSVSNEYHTLPGMITLGFTALPTDAGWSIGKTEASALIGKILADPISQTEFDAAKRSMQTLWSRRDTHSFWLDADTYKTASLETERRLVEGVTSAEVNAYAEKARKLPIASVFVHTPPQAG